MAAERHERFQDSHPFRLFPTLVWRVELADEVRRRVNANALQAADALRGPIPPLRPGQGWQSRRNLHERDSFAELVACIEAAAAQTLAYLKIGHRGFRITGCWLNVLAPGRGHAAHSHPNNFLSGVYYVKTQEGADTVNFHDPRAQTRVIRPPVTELTADNTDQVVVRVKDGTLLVFPAWLEHSVDANRSATNRISVSFNLMFEPYIEAMSKPMW